VEEDLHPFTIKLKTMTSIIRAVLFKEVPKPSSLGRSIKFEESDPDIRFSTGTMHERVMGYLKERDEPLSAKDIATGIGSTTSRVYVQLKRLAANRFIEVINVDGFHPEYWIRSGRDNID
jgi:hypothetical protein